MDALSDRFSRVHILGVGGVGMSALAQALLDRGVRVSGVDRFRDQGVSVPIFHKLTNAGVSFFSEEMLPTDARVDALVVSTAIEEDHPVMQQAQRTQIPVLHRAAMMQELVTGHSLIGVAGTAGKSTVTAMIGWMLEQAGVDPNVLNGAELVSWQASSRVGSTRMGQGDVWVCELDESDRSCLRFEPDWLVLTNISVDHYDLSELQRVFRQLAEQTKQGVICGPGVPEQLQGVLPAKLHAQAACSLTPTGFVYQGVEFEVPMLGRHNIENAQLAVAVCERWGCSLPALVEGLRTFKGVHRRLQCVGVVNEITVVDDYAHNPMKIAAAWQALAERHARLVGVWRPHGFKPLAVMIDELVKQLPSVIREQDRFYVLPVFYAGGTSQMEVTSDELVERLVAQGVPAEHVDTYDDLEEEFITHMQSGDALLVLGARDPALPAFAKRMVEQLKNR